MGKCFVLSNNSLTFASMKERDTNIDFIRAILILLMILIHIVSFGNAYPQLKAGILSFMMPTFLIITGYLVNIEKNGRQMGKYLMCLALPYVIMVTGFSVLSYFMPVRDGITELSLAQIGEKIFVTSIGPYWFIQTMMICGTLYYFAFKGTARMNPHKDAHTPTNTPNRLFCFAVLLAIVSQLPALSPAAAFYYFIGVAIRQSQISWGKMFRPALMALPLWIYLLSREDWYDWGSIAVVLSCWCCISILTWTYSLGCRLNNKSTQGANSKLSYTGRNTLYIAHNTLLYIGRNTLPIYLFHPIFTMAAKYYHPLFAFDKSEMLFALITVALSVSGSIAIAKLLEATKLAYIFGKGKILR